jgi:diaminopimelate epimerase
MNYPIKFTKMTGTGNDFILADNRQGLIPAGSMKELAMAICRRGQSVGADGLILIKDDDQFDFAWDFFNSDGSEAEMCGNGARCAARFAVLEGICGKEMTFRTQAGPISGLVDDDMVKVQLTAPEDLRESVHLDLPDGSEVAAGFVNTGVPHVIITMTPDELAQAPIEEIGRHVRFHQKFAPAGTNVNLIAVGSDGAIRIRTYERGVEGETLACGTGSVAAALLTTLAGKVKPPVRVQAASGDILTIHLNEQGPMQGDVFLEGKASLVYRGELTGETV